MILVDSSSIESVGYDGALNLYVRFMSGKLYTFRHVPRFLYLGLLGAKSSGKYFNENVKGRYSFAEEEPADIAKDC